MPGAAGVHTVAPLVSEYVPGTQNCCIVAPDPATKLPASAWMQLVWPALGW